MSVRNRKQQRRSRRNGKICGDFGGVSAETGEPCGNHAGHGSPKRTGPCSLHTAEGLADLAQRKQLFLEHFGCGLVSMKTACEETGINPITIWRWRACDEAFDEAYQSAQQTSDAVRTSYVEDSLFARSIAGRAHAAETIFFLKNRSNGRWTDRRELTGAEGKDLIPLALIREIIAEDERERGE
ncbi:MAG: hypothetical protein ABIW79_02385 [Gemmatimonas sp.]